MNLKPPALSAVLVSICCFCTTAFAQKVIPVDTSHVRIIRIDPTNANGGSVSDIFSEVEYTPLESTKESLFGSIGEMEVTDDRYLILERQRNYLFIFNKQGKFIKRLGSESKPIGQFAYNKWTKRFLLKPEGSMIATYYDLDGNAITKENLDVTGMKDKSGQQLYYLSKDKGFIEGYYYKDDPTSKHYKNFLGSLIAYGGTDRVIYAKGLQYPESQNGLDMNTIGRSVFITHSDADSVYYYSKVYDYAIYAISPDRIQLKYKFMFPANIALPAGFATDTTLHGKRWIWFDKNTEYIRDVMNFYQLGNNLIFTARTSSSTDEDELIYNLKTGALYGYRHVMQDQSNYFLPIYERGMAHTGGGIITLYNHSIYTSMSSLEMFDKYEENKDKKLKYPPHLETYFTTRDRKDNPVIVRLKLKDEI